jgi:hypothetical protein
MERDKCREYVRKLLGEKSYSKTELTQEVMKYCLEQTLFYP